MRFRFPIQHYGKLFGLMIFLGSTAQFVQVPLLRWAEHSSFQNVSDMLFIIISSYFMTSRTNLKIKFNSKIFTNK